MHWLQRLGFAEADPTSDVAGHDARNKLVLLARLAFGTTLREGDVVTRGIQAVSADDIELASTLGCVVRLIGRAERVADKLHSFVGPALVPVSVSCVSIGAQKRVLACLITHVRRAQWPRLSEDPMRCRYVRHSESVPWAVRETHTAKAMLTHAHIHTHTHTHTHTHRTI